ncbi:MAG: cupin domain-containing protein [Elusimicrobiota bacterium]|nr:cupin domain-containing protein [Elusimicrobiota bacterium]
MRKTVLIIAVSAAIAVSLAFAAGSPQLFKQKDLKTWDRNDVAGGTGTLYGKFSFTRNDAKKSDTIKEIGWMTLKPGASIGMHKHTVNEDAYIIVSGEGEFIGDDGKVIKVKDGDITIARVGQSHALKNTGKTDLIFLDIVAQDSEK